MNPRNLYKLIESFGTQQVKNERALLKHVLNEIVRRGIVDAKGTRLWVLDANAESYRLVYQVGTLQPLPAGYRLSYQKYPLVESIGEHRSIIANETDKELKKFGIHRFLATGVGERIERKGRSLYPYILSFSSDSVDQTILPELNVISIALSSLLRHRIAERQAFELERDLDKAAEILQKLLPAGARQFHSYDMYSFSKSARVVGGDFFDIFGTGEENERIGIVIADAASKGLKAAAQALYVLGALRMGVAERLKISALMSRLNRILNRSFAEDQFVSLFYCELFSDTKGLVLYSNAGHNSPLRYDAAGRRIEFLEPTGQILGPFPNERFHVNYTSMNVGDILVLYTDGISEAVGAEMTLYGEQRIVRLVEESHRLDAKEIAERILADVDSFCAGDEPQDDKTIIVVKRSR